MPGDTLPVSVVSEILECDFPFRIDGPEDGVDHIIDVFIFRLDSADCVQVTVQFRPMFCAGHRNNFVHKLAALSCGDKLGSLYRIDQEIQLRKLELAVSKIVAVRTALQNDDFYSAGVQCIYSPRIVFRSMIAP